MTTRRPIIDLHSHWLPPSTVEILGKRHAAPRLTNVDGQLFIDGGPGSPRAGAAFPLGPQWFDIDARLAHLDAAGIAHQLISWPTTLGVDASLEREDSTPLWRAWNDDVSALVRAHPTRFSAVAALSTSDIAWSARELERAHEKLGLIGGVLPVGGFFSPESARQLAPIFEVAQRYRSHIYLHTGFAHPSVTGQPPIVEHSDPSIVRWVIGSGYAFASGVATLAYTDFLRPYPDVTVQVAMLGGTGLGALIAEQAAIAPQFMGPTLTQAFGQIWLDTGAAGSGSAAIAAAIRVLGSDRVVFGSDYAPVPSVLPVIDRVNEAVLGQNQADRVFFGNAQLLLQRHGATLATLQTTSGELV